MNKKILLVGLSAIALAGCGLKDYENNVKYEDFLTEFRKIAEENAILNPEKIYSFSLELEKEGKSVDTYLKNDKKLYEEINEESETGKYEFDSENCVLKLKDKYEESQKDASSKQIESTDFEIVYQMDAKAVYTVDTKAKTFSKYSTEDGRKAIEAIASRGIVAYIQSFAMKAQLPDLNFFIDDNVYTIEEKITEEDETKTKNVLSVYQFTLLEDGYDYCEETSIEIKELNFKTVDKSTSTVKLRKKDVSLKTTDLTDYLELTND